MLKDVISFVYQDKKGQVTRRSLTNYSIVRKDDNVYLTGQDSIRANAIRRFIRNQIIAISKLDNTKDECSLCGCKYHDNKDFVVNEKILATYCLVCEYLAAQSTSIRCLS